MVPPPDRFTVPTNATRKSSGEEAALYVRRLIFDGELVPGQRVPQDEIAQILGISRIPLREALIALEREGWVTLEMHRGAFVNALDENVVRDHYQLIGLVYGFAMKRALARSGDELVGRLAAMTKELQEADDPVAAGALAFSLYAAIVDAARSPRLKVLLRAMSSLVPDDFFVAVPTALVIERGAFPTIVAALRRGDSEKAAHEFARMMDRVGNEVVALFRQRGLFGDGEAASA